MLQTIFPVAGPAALAYVNGMINKQALFIAYLDDFKLMMIVTFAVLPLLLFMRRGKQGRTAAGRRCIWIKKRRSMFQVGKRRLGRDGPEVSAIGLGCMGMSEFYGGGSEAESIATIHHALDRGVTFLDTADMYGWGSNEELVGRAIARPPRRGLPRDQVRQRARAEWRVPRRPRRPGICPLRLRGEPEAAGVETIDLYYQHRVDPKVPIEDTVGAMARLKEEGKVRFLGLSEAAPRTIRRGACDVTPITAVQTEFSLWSRDAEAEVLPTVRELGIGYVAYSPLGRGFLTGQFKSPDDFPEDDFRRNHPRFQGENFEKNIELVDEVEAMAGRRAAPPPSSRSPGCSRRATTSCRSRAPSTSTISTRISARSRSS